MTDHTYPSIMQRNETYADRPPQLNCTAHIYSTYIQHTYAAHINSTYTTQHTLDYMISLRNQYKLSPTVTKYCQPHLKDNLYIAYILPTIYCSHQLTIKKKPKLHTDTRKQAANSRFYTCSSAIKIHK